MIEILFEHEKPVGVALAGINLFSSSYDITDRYRKTLIFLYLSMIYL